MNTKISGHAKELERILRTKLPGKVNVGWMRNSDGAEWFIVYVTHASDELKHVPNSWYGREVAVQVEDIDYSSFMFYSGQVGQ